MHSCYLLSVAQHHMLHRTTDLQLERYLSALIFLTEVCHSREAFGMYNHLKINFFHNYW